MCNNPLNISIIPSILIISDIEFAGENIKNIENIISSKDIAIDDFMYLIILSVISASLILLKTVYYK